MEKKFINPEIIDNFPVVVLADDLRWIVSAIVKSHTKGNYNHSMMLYKSMECASQDFTVFHSIQLNKYMKSGIMLKFWSLKISEDKKKEIISKIEKDLKKPWWCRLYDFLGIFGQAVHIRWIQNPFKQYCSESACQYLKVDNNLNKIVGKRLNPSELNKLFESYPEYFECLGYYLAE